MSDDISEEVSSNAQWSRLDPHSADTVLTRLPITTLARCGVVCRDWKSLLSNPSFASYALHSKPRPPWFFLFGQSNVVSKNNAAFAYDPEAKRWATIRTAGVMAVAGSGGLVFASEEGRRMKFAPLLKAGCPAAWRGTAPMLYERLQPLVAVIPRGFLVAGGVRFVGGLVDIEDRQTVEIYDRETDTWELCPPLPSDFRSGNTSQWLCSALVGTKFYIMGINSGYLSSFDLNSRLWSSVVSIRPPGVVFSFLVPCHGHVLLAGFCVDQGMTPVFRLFVMEDSGGVRVIGNMPKEFLIELSDSEEEDKFASLKCVGGEGLVYVFNQEGHRLYPACVCSVSEDFRCSWSLLPSPPHFAGSYHRVVSFCSLISPECIVC